MRQELDGIFTGPAIDCGAKGFTLVHACKTCHKNLCGQPAKDHPDYLAAEDDGALYLNLIDPEAPLFQADLFRRFVAWAEPRHRAGERILIHCDQGKSRSRSLALLLGVVLGKLPRASFIAAATAFSRVSGEPYRPSAGIRLFLTQHWNEVLEPLVTKARAKPLATVAKADTWKASGAKEIAEERELNGGYTLAELDEIAERPSLWARLHGKVEDRVTKAPIKFVPSPLQSRMFLWYEVCQAAENPCRMIVPKIRRGGGSTGAEAIMYCHAHNYVSRIGSIGTDDEVAMNMQKMVRFFDKHDDFPGWGRAIKILETGLIAWANGSTWDKYTAERPDAARSAGLQGYHSSEGGRWPNGGAKDAKETLRSMLGAVPRRGFTVVIEESTARGAVGAFYDRFQGGRWPTAEELGVAEGMEFWRKWADETPQNIAGSDTERALQFVRIFAAWFEDDENRPERGITGEEERKIRATLDAKEQKLIARYMTLGPQGERLGTEAVKATVWEQLAWRRAVIATEFEGDEEGFEQENPSSPAEAFASSGRHTFNRAGCAWMLAQAKTKTARIGVLDRQHDGHVIFRETDRAHAWMMLWDEPREGMRYIESVDTMGGRSNVKNIEDADYNAAHVLRAAYIVAETGEKLPARVVASLCSKNQDDPDVLATRAGLLSDFYGHCLCVHEDNNTGAAFRQEAQRLGLNLYRRVETDKFTAEPTEYVGWQTNAETRPQLFSTGKRHMRNNAKSETRADGVECWNETACQEASDCILGDDGKDAAPGSKHDDSLLALLIGLHCISGATYFAGRRRKRTGPADRSLWRPSR